MFMRPPPDGRLDLRCPYCGVAIAVECADWKQGEQPRDINLTTRCARRSTAQALSARVVRITRRWEPEL